MSRSQVETAVCPEMVLTDHRTLPLIRRLAEKLEAQEVAYCHWKSNWRLHHWVTGDGDLDLLVAPADTQRFIAILSQLGFKRAVTSEDRQVPGIVSFYGFDTEASRFVHVHAHYQLVLGHDLTKNYHLPLEKPFLESAGQEGFPRRSRSCSEEGVRPGQEGFPRRSRVPAPRLVRGRVDCSEEGVRPRPGLLRVPAPEFELILFVLRMVLKYSVIDRLLVSSPSASSNVQQELAWLQERVSDGQVKAILREHLPFIDPSFFRRCVESLRPGCPDAVRLAVRLRLQRQLQAHARRPFCSDALLKLSRRVTRIGHRLLRRKPARKQLARGGAIIALVGGDGAGKSTCVKQIHTWLSKKFDTTTIHLGKPPRSPATLAVIVGLRVSRMIGRGSGGVSPASNRHAGETPPLPGVGCLQLLRWVLGARDRYRLYTRARRIASNGGLVICDRYPVPQIQLMEGSNIARCCPTAGASRLVQWLCRAETWYYQQIIPPELLIVLRVDPEIAVQRKTTEDPEHVRVRSTELWQVDWQGSRAHVIDAGRPMDEVFSELKSLVWSEL